MPKSKKNGSKLAQHVGKLANMTLAAKAVSTMGKDVEENKTELSATVAPGSVAG